MPSLLFSPITIGSLELPNRLVVSPMCQYSAHDGDVGDWHAQHLSQLGYSGAGLVIVEATGVDARGRITHACAGLYSDDNEAALRTVLATARRWAGPARFGIQIAHAGRKASARRPWEGGGPLAAHEMPWPTVSSSTLPFAEGWPSPHALSPDEIDGVVAAWAHAARRAVRAGFDLIEIHGAHGYLIHQFLSPLVNTRTDEFGGALGNRMRCPLAIVRAVREAVPAAMPVGMRVSATDWVDGGWDLGQTITFVRAARELGIDYVCVSSGGTVSGVTAPVAPGYHVPFAREIKQKTDLRTIAVGLITHARQAEEILERGDADLIALARAFLDDPRWGWHAADELGGTTHVPPQYALARTAGWRKFRDSGRNLTSDF
jgi:2,4-dienoyl-CoA reductase-like NADH-dependent reductase (Old Yellow Enzyme family)